MDEIIYASASSLARAIRDGEVSSREVVEAYLTRIEEVNPVLNAVVQLTADAAREEARAADEALARGDETGPLHGVPMTIKDAIETEGVICTGGTQGRAAFVPAADATVVARLRAAGAILLGKTNLPELSFGFETENLVYGRTNNPYDLTRTPGGSTGGEAALIACGASPFGLGADSGGSIRQPSHFCGIAGIRPNTGRVPTTGHFPYPGGAADPLNQIGPMARYVEDLGLILSIIAGPDGRHTLAVPAPLGNPEAVDLKALRVSFHTDNGIATPTPEIIETVKSAARALADAGAAVEEARPEGLEQTPELMGGIFGGDGGAAMRAVLEEAGTTEVHPRLAERMEAFRSLVMPTPDYVALLARWDAFRTSMLGFMENYDLIICPVNAYCALPHGAGWENLPAFRYTSHYNLTGWPGAVVRCGTSPEGLPIGVQVVARPWREDVALAAAGHLEAEMGGWRRPAL